VRFSKFEHFSIYLKVQCRQSCFDFLVVEKMVKKCPFLYVHRLSIQTGFSEKDFEYIFLGAVQAHCYPSFTVHTNPTFCDEMKISKQK